MWQYAGQSSADNTLWELYKRNEFKAPDTQYAFVLDLLYYLKSS